MAEYCFRFLSIHSLDNRIKIRVLFDLILALTCVLIVCYIGLPLSFLGFINNRDARCQYEKQYDVKLLHHNDIYECAYMNKTTKEMDVTIIFDHYGEIPWNMEYVKIYIQIAVIVMVCISTMALLAYVILNLFVFQITETNEKHPHHVTSIIGVIIGIILTIVFGILIASCFHDIGMTVTFICLGMPISSIIIIGKTFIMWHHVKDYQDPLRIPIMTPIDPPPTYQNYQSRNDNQITYNTLYN